MNGPADASDPRSDATRSAEDRPPAKPPLTREQQLLVGRILASKPLPSRPKRFRYEWLAPLGGVTWTMLLLSYWAFWALSGRHSLLAVLLAIATAVNLPVTFLIMPLFKRRAVAFIRKHHAFICPRCHYPLDHLPDEGQCPECATLYTRTQVVDLWRWQYRIKDPFPTAGSAK